MHCAEKADADRQADHVSQVPAMMVHVDNVTDLLNRPVYGMGQVDRVLCLKPGTARRWIDGYERGGRRYEPVVRHTPTGARPGHVGRVRRDASSVRVS